MDPKSEAILTRVHPALVLVMRSALQTPQPFEVYYGLRTYAAEQAAVASHHSTTMHSRHLANKDGLACAVDVAHLINHHIDFAPGHEPFIYGAIAIQIHMAAMKCNTPVEWGGDWETFKDWGHFQLPWGKYP